MTVNSFIRFTVILLGLIISANYARAGPNQISLEALTVTAFTMSRDYWISGRRKVRICWIPLQVSD